jgi:ribosomal protein L32
MEPILMDEENNWPIYADFNAMDEDGAIRLFSPHPTMDSRKKIVIPENKGRRIWISDGEVETIGKLNFRNGIWVAVPVRDTLKEIDEKATYSKKNLKLIKEKQKKMDDENGNCKQCGHPFNPHIIIAYDTKDFSKGGEMRCPVNDCKCFNIIDFNFEE